MRYVGWKVVGVMTLTVHLFRSAAMVNFIALCALALSYLAATGCASVSGNSTTARSEADLGKRVAGLWWAVWKVDLLPLEKVSWKKYTQFTYALARGFIYPSFKV